MKDVISAIPGEAICTMYNCCMMRLIRHKATWKPVQYSHDSIFCQLSKQPALNAINTDTMHLTKIPLRSP